MLLFAIYTVAFPLSCLLLIFLEREIAAGNVLRFLSRPEQHWEEETRIDLACTLLRSLPWAIRPAARELVQLAAAIQHGIETRSKPNAEAEARFERQWQELLQVTVERNVSNRVAAMVLLRLGIDLDEVEQLLRRGRTYCLTLDEKFPSQVIDLAWKTALRE